MSDDDDRQREMMNLVPSSWDQGPMILASEIRMLIAILRDEGSTIDMGGGDGMADLWIKTGGVEYIITIKPVPK